MLDLSREVKRSPTSYKYMIIKIELQRANFTRNNSCWALRYLGLAVLERLKSFRCLHKVRTANISSYMNFSEGWNRTENDEKYSGIGV